MCGISTEIGSKRLAIVLRLSCNYSKSGLEFDHENNPRARNMSANPGQPIRLTLGFAVSEADRELVERLTVAMGARSLSQAVHGAV